MPSGTSYKLKIGCVARFLNSYGTEQDLYTNTSKYGVLESTSSMDVLQEIILMIDHIVVISWDMQLLQELLYTGIQTRPFLSTYTIMFGLMNITLVYIYRTITLQVIYYFKNTLEVLLMINTS